MAGVYQDKGDNDKAMEFYEQALAIQEKVLGKDHPSTAIIYNNMAWLYREQSDYGKALEYYKKACHVRLSVFGENHPYTQDTAQGIREIELLLMSSLTENELEELPKNPTPE